MSLTRLGIGNRMIENVLIVQCSIILAFFFCTLEHSIRFFHTQWHVYGDPNK